MEPESTPVVPAHRLLEVAQLLTDGAARLHSELRGLPPDRRQAVLDAVAGQVGDILRAWSQLVQAVVSVEAAPAGDVAPVTPPDHSVAAAEQVPAPGSPATDPAPVSDREQLGAAPRQWRRADRPDSGLAEARHPVSVSSTGTDGADGWPAAARAGAGALEQTAGSASPRDELTGVLNRQGGYAAIEAEMARCRRDGVHLVLGYLNVDAMREVNELRGTQGGDELLRKVAAALRATLRSYDVVMRLAGDEFLFSLPGADLTTAEKRIKEFGILLGEEAPGASVSVGFAELQPEDTFEDMVARADDALVQARRRRGRRRLH
jgi:diguanylate cyclase (GGDEF)-like protein